MESWRVENSSSGLSQCSEVHFVFEDNFQNDVNPAYNLRGFK